jgi:hypothetical protein
MSDPVALPAPLQLSRKRGATLPAGAVKVDRATDFGNPFPDTVFGLGPSLRAFEVWLREGPDAVRREVPEAWALSTGKLAAERRSRLLQRLPSLKGKRLACWCSLPGPGEVDQCHRRILAELANG